MIQKSTTLTYKDLIWEVAKVLNTSPILLKIQDNRLSPFSQE